jgi:NAD(P) transhydrogenase subunit alpha
VLGALIVLGNLSADAHWGVRIIAFVALIFGTLNVIGGFLVTDRMLGMFKGRKPSPGKALEKSSENAGAGK